MFETKKNKYWPMILIVVIIIVLLGGFFWWRSSTENNSNNNNNAATPTPTATYTPTSTTTPTTTVTLTPTVTSTTTPTDTVTPTPTSTGPVQVKVYYSQGANPTDSSAPDSYKQFEYAVYRVFTTSRGDVETYVLEQEIAGPSASDQSTYYWFTPIKLTGTSNCGGKDFTLTKNADGSKVTVKFCKDVTSAGVGDDARVKSIVKYGITQFSPTTTVIILTKDDNCFGDMSGMNVCKS